MELEADPNRQAHDTIGGFEYQFWQSVLAWLRLDDQSELRVEGAEDYDIIKPESATAVQTKRLKAPLTLRSEAVREAIDNAYALFQRHPEQLVFYRFVSTADIATEKGSPFGPNTKGIEIWKRSHNDADAAEKLTAFLLAEGKQSPAVLKFLREHEPKAVGAKFFSRVAFDLGAVDMGTLRTLVEDELIRYGEKFSVTPGESKKVAAVLLREVVQVASTRDGPLLTHRKFAEIFESQTQVSIPLNSIAEVIGKMVFTPATGFGSGSTALQLELLGQTQPPPLPSHCLPRLALAQEICQIIRTHGSVYFHGGTGTGKSTLALLAAKLLNTPIHWIDAGSIEGAALVSTIAMTLNQALSSRKAAVLVLDDLDVPPNEMKRVIGIMRVVKGALLSVGGFLIITSQRSPEGSWTTDLASNETSRKIPPLLLAEIEEFAKNLGCPPGQSTATATVVRLQTEGHPQLAHASLKGLQQKRWPVPTETDFWQPVPEMAEARRNARRLLAAAQSEGAKELIYRLSLWGRFFRRSHMLAIGDIAPELSDTGDVFDDMVGPWVEALSEEFFRLSPLLRSAAEDVWSAEKIKKLRPLIAEAALKLEKLTPAEIAEVLKIGLNSAKADLIAPVVFALFSFRWKQTNLFANDFGWLPFWGGSASPTPFPSNRVLNTHVRWWQGNIAAEQGDPQAVRFIHKALEELPALGTDEATDASRFLLAMETLVISDIPLSVSSLIKLLNELFAAGTVVGSYPAFEALKKIKTGRLWGEGPLEAADFAALALFRAKPEVNQREWYAQFAEACGKDSANLETAFRQFFKRIPFMGFIWVDAIWLAEEDAAEPDWQKALETLKILNQQARTWGIPGLVEATARGMIIVLGDYCGREAEALVIAKAALSQLVEHTYRLDDAYASLLSRSNRKEEALDIWRRIFPQLRISLHTSDTFVLFALNRAGQTAGDLERWRDATMFFERGIEESRKVREVRLQIGFNSDLAFAAWRLENFALCSEKLQQAMERLVRLPTSKKDLRTFKLWKTVGHVAMYIDHYFSGDVTDFITLPRAGMCSNIDAPNKWAELADPDAMVTIGSICSIESNYLGRHSFFEKHAAVMSESRVPAARMAWIFNAFACSVEKGAWRDVPMIAIKCAKFMIASKGMVGTANKLVLITEWEGNWDEVAVKDEDVLAIMIQGSFAALAMGAANGTALQTILRGFLDYEGDHAEKIKKWGLSAMEFVEQTTVEQAHALLQSPQAMQDDNRRTLALLISFLSRQGSANMLLRTHAGLWDHLNHNLFKTVVGRPIGRAFDQAWRAMTNYPAALQNSRQTIPAILNACDKRPWSMRSAANVLLAAQQATSLRLGEVQPKMQKVKL